MSESKVDDDVILLIQNELREYKRFFEETPIALFRTDLKTGKFLMANKFCAKLLGYECVEDIVLNGRKSSMYDRETRNLIIDRIRKQGYITNFEMRLCTKSGNIVWVLASIHINCGGSCLEGSMIDITQQKIMEEEQERTKVIQLTKLSDINGKLSTLITNY